MKKSVRSLLPYWCTYWLALCSLVLILVSPLSVDTIPPLLDYPIHLARSYIYGEYENNHILRAMFNIDWRPIPNLGSDVALLFLTKIFTIETSGRILLAIIMILNVTGVVILHRVNFQCWSFWPFIVVLPAYHGALGAGFLNYSIGLSLVPFALSVHIVTRGSGFGVNLLLNSISVIILYFCHIISVAIFGFLLFGAEFWIMKEHLFSFCYRRKILTKIISIIVPFIVPAVLYVKFSFFEIMSRSDPMVIGDWSFVHKIRGVFMPILSGLYFYDLVALMFIIFIFTIVLFSKDLVIEKGLLFGCGIIALCFFVLPSHMLEAAFIMDRLPIACILIAIASINPMGFGRARLFLITALSLFLAAWRSSFIAIAWGESDIYYQRLNRVLANVEPGSSVMIASPITRIEGRSLRFWHDVRMTAPNWHFALLNIPALHSMAVLPLTKRSAFSQIHFVWTDKQVLSLSGEFEHLDYGDGGASTWHPAEVLIGGESPTCRSEPVDKAMIENWFAIHESEAAVESDNCGLGQKLSVHEYVRNFDYILFVYTNYFYSGFSNQIQREFVSYSDEGIVLMEVPSPDSWRTQNLDRIEQTGRP